MTTIVHEHSSAVDSGSQDSNAMAILLTLVGLAFVLFLFITLFFAPTPAASPVYTPVETPLVSPNPAVPSPGEPLTSPVNPGTLPPSSPSTPAPTNPGNPAAPAPF